MEEYHMYTMEINKQNFDIQHTCIHAHTVECSWSYDISGTYLNVNLRDTMEYRSAAIKAFEKIIFTAGSNY